MIEAMACGTPVLAYRARAVAEIVEPGVTGLIVDDIHQARIALVQAISMDRRKIRRCFEERFTARRPTTMSAFTARPTRGAPCPRKTSATHCAE